MHVFTNLGDRAVPQVQVAEEQPPPFKIRYDLEQEGYDDAGD